MSADVSSIGADHRSSTFYLKCKGDIERDCAELQFKTFSVFRPSMLEAESRPTFRCGERSSLLRLQQLLIMSLLAGECFGLFCMKWICCCCFACCCDQVRL